MQHLCSSASGQASAALLPALDFLQEIIKGFCFTLLREGETYVDEKARHAKPPPTS